MKFEWYSEQMKEANLGANVVAFKHNLTTI